MAKRLYKSNTNKVISGVCGGISEYFNIDPTLVRLGMVFFSLWGGSGIVAYIIAALIMPSPPNYPYNGDMDWYDNDHNQSNGSSM